MTGTTRRRRTALEERRIGHIFREAAGHTPIDAAENRQLLLKVANNPATSLGTDRFGTQCAASNLADGRLVWVQIGDDRITNGGVNQRPRDFARGLGLLRPNPDRGAS